METSTSAPVETWTVESLPTDTELAIQQLAKSASTPSLNSKAGMPLHIATKTSLYTIIRPKTKVDRELDAGAAAGKLRLFASPSEPWVVFVTTTKVYLSHVQRVFDALLKRTPSSSSTGFGVRDSLATLRAFLVHVAAVVPSISLSRTRLMEELVKPVPESGGDALGLAWWDSLVDGRVGRISPATLDMLHSLGSVDLTTEEARKEGLSFLIRSHLVLPGSMASLYFSLPHAGTFISAYAKSISKVLAIIKRSKYKEMDERDVLAHTSLTKLPIALPFLVSDLKSRGLVHEMHLGNRTLLRLPLDSITASRSSRASRASQSSRSSTSTASTSTASNRPLKRRARSSFSHRRRR